MKGGINQGNVIKRSVSLSHTVNQWAEDMAKARGQETNFSAFLADLIREAKQREAATQPKTPERMTPEERKEAQNRAQVEKLPNSPGVSGFSKLITAFVTGAAAELVSARKPPSVPARKPKSRAPESKDQTPRP